uniref:Uncharacterized protein n=1 Tax=Anopheles epiroticus TaxID=199890 RepID=A0A182PLL2_9DIPT
MDANHDTDEGEQGLAGQPAPPAVEDFLPVAAYEEEAAEYSVENRSDENGSDEGDLRLQDAADHVGDAVPLAEGENGNDDVNLDTSRSYSDEEELSSSDSWDSPYHDEDDDDDESSYTSYSLIIPENLTNHDDLWNPDPSFGYYSDGKDLSQCALPDRPYGDASYVEGLRLWALETGQSEESLNLLLAHTKQHNPQYNLPQEARAFINKPGSNKAKTEVMRIIRGQLWYQGIEKCLRLSISNITTSECTLMLDFFVDRLRLSNSSQNQMWILLMKICSVPEAPAMTVAIYYGKSKPVHIDEFLGPFVSEINELQSNDFTHQSFTYEVVFRAFKTDPTAHAFVLGLRSRSLHGLCMRCTIASKRCKNRVYFPYCTERSPRTDAQFRMSTYMLENNVQYTPLLQMHNLNFITDFVVSGKMYLTDRGIAAQLMFLWTRGFPGVQCKLTARQQHKVSKHLRQLALPSDFRRSLRDLKFVHVWKAVEYKVFLEIVGFVVLKGRLSNAAYRHFMLLFVAITILSTPHHSGKYHEAETLLERFVAEYGLVYSQELVNSNVHSLLHVFEDVESENA